MFKGFKDVLYDISKRFLDFFIVLPALILLLPLMVFFMAAIKLTSRGQAIFSQERAGKNGLPFIIYKLRTMRVDVDPFGHSPKSADDPRITKIGKFLREYSLDELPQLLNVFKGEMSIVGPRPLYVAQIQEWNERQKRRLEVKPGLTGLAQISGRGSLTFEQKLELDVTYVEQRSFWLDVKIIFITLAYIFNRRAVYEHRYSEKEEIRGEGE